MILIKRLSVFILLCVCLSSCTVQDGTGIYRIETVGDAKRTTLGVVIASDKVFIDFNTGNGANIGGVVGGSIAASNSDNLGVVIAGIVGGALIGNEIERSSSIKNATQYVIHLETGADITVAQLDEGNRLFDIGDSVYIVYGYPVKLIPVRK